MLFCAILTGIVIFSFSIPYQNKSQLDKDPLDIYVDSLRTALVGKEFANLGFTDSLNNKFDLQSLRGNVVAINIWGFGCKPCIKEIPKLNDLVDKYKDQPVKFLSILGSGEGVQFKDTSFLRLFKPIKFKYTTVRTDRSLKQLFNFQNIFPQHIILDKKGLVVDYFADPRTERLDSVINVYK